MQPTKGLPRNPPPPNVVPAAPEANNTTQQAILQQALLSRPDAMTGQRRCQACGKIYTDILRLAQHLKDKHNGRNQLLPDNDNDDDVTKRVSLADLLFASMSQQTRQSKKQTERKRSNPLHHDDKKKKKDTKQLSTTTRKGGGASSSSSSSNAKQPRQHKKNNKKKTTKLKKGFLRSKALAAESYWQDVLSDIECSLASLRESSPPPSVGGVGVGVGVPNDDHHQQQQQQTGEAVMMGLHEMARQQLQHVQSKIKQLDASSSVEVKNDNNNDSEQLVIIQDNPSSSSNTLFSSNIEEEVALLDIAYSNEEEEEEEDDMSVESESSVDTSSSSDSSFCMQWGDTLKSWANNVGKEAGGGGGGSKAKTKQQQLPKPQQASSTVVVKKPSINAAITIDKPFIGDKVEERQQQQQKESSAPPPQPPAAAAPPLVDTDVPGAPDKPELYCEVCKVKMTGRQNFADHLVGRKHRANVLKMNKHNLGDQSSSSSSSSLSLIPPLPTTITPTSKSTTSKCYTGPGADAESYVNQVITPQLNTTVSDFITKLLEWQERVRRNDPVNFKRKRRLVSGLREAMKLVKLGKVQLLIVAPNVGSVVDADGREECPVAGLLDGARRREVPVVFALTRQKLGRLLGRQKYASAFAVLNCSGAEEMMKDIIKMAKKGEVE